MSNSTEVKSLEALELAKDKALQVNTNMATMVQLEQGSTAYCTMYPYKSPELEPELAMWLWEMHVGAHHHYIPPHSVLFPYVLYKSPGSWHLLC